MALHDSRTLRLFLKERKYLLKRNIKDVRFLKDSLRKARRLEQKKVIDKEVKEFFLTKGDRRDGNVL